MYACLYQPARDNKSLLTVAADFSPRYECHRDGVVSIDISGLGRLFGSAREIGEELRRDAERRGLRIHVAIAATRTAALVLALARPGLVVVEPGEERHAVASIPLGVLENVGACGHEAPSEPARRGARLRQGSGGSAEARDESFELPALTVFKTWGLKTLGELAALPSDDLAARLGSQGLVWQAIARGEDTRPLVPTLPDERFEASLDLEWPIEGLEPLSFVLTRLLEPLSIRLERRDRGAAVLHVELRLVGTGSAPRTIYTRSLQLPSPMRDVRTLRTLALLDLESHPPAAAVDRVAVAIDPTPGRVLQHRLFTRAHPTPEQLSTLLARLGALMGQDRIGAPATVDSYRPGAFEMKAFEMEHRRAGEAGLPDPPDQPDQPHQPAIISALRRCREPVPARVAIADGRPVRVTTDRRGFAGGVVVQAAGPWRTSGQWWSGRWFRDEWDVALSDGAVYRIFQDRETDAWFIDGIVD
jgi:protein ImuB